MKAAGAETVRRHERGIEGEFPGMGWVFWLEEEGRAYATFICEDMTASDFVERLNALDRFGEILRWLQAHLDLESGRG